MRPGFERSSTARYFGEPRRVAASSVVGASLVGAVSAGRTPRIRAKCCFPGSSRMILGVLGGDVVTVRCRLTDLRDVRRRNVGTHLWAADVATGFTSSGRVIRFLDHVRAEGRALFAAVPLRPGVHVPPRACAHRHRRHVVPGGARLAGAIALMNESDTQPGVRGALMALAIADLYRAPLGLRDAPPLPSVYTTLARQPGRRSIELPVLGGDRGLSPARGIHAGVDRALAAADQRLQRSHSAGLSRQRAILRRVS